MVPTYGECFIEGLSIVGAHDVVDKYVDARIGCLKYESDGPCDPEKVVVLSAHGVLRLKDHPHETNHSRGKA